MLGSSAQRLAGRGAIVTGAASGIGAATAEAFVRDGATTLLVDVDQDALARVVSSLAPRGHACAVDLRDEEAIAVVIGRALEVLPAIDVLVNDAGISSKTPFLDVTEAEWDLVLGVNAWAAARLARACAREMGDRGSGCILNVSSISGLGGGPPQSVYGISKGALLGLTRELRAELAPRGIRVNAVLPGVIDTPMVRRDVAEGGDPDGTELRRWIADAVPAGRIGRPEEVANVLTFLASPDGAAIDGAFVPVEGGFLSA
jgi:NAD(P)-dependent dehydrogenase (short-subunit alcohol dehydrogenase family)